MHIFRISCTFSVMKRVYIIIIYCIVDCTVEAKQWLITAPRFVRGPCGGADTNEQRDWKTEKNINFLFCLCACILFSCRSGRDVIQMVMRGGIYPLLFCVNLFCARCNLTASPVHHFHFTPMADFLSSLVVVATLDQQRYSSRTIFPASF